jgi:hypothetical protein
MSGLVKGIGKIFKKVFNVVKKVAVPLLAIGAIVFTGGAALGLAPLAGGWGGAVTAGLSAMGVNTAGALGSVLTSVGTQAGIGAAIGGVTNVAMGGKFGDGAAMGALGGAVTGGLTGVAGLANGGAGLLGGGKAAGTVTASSRSANGLLPSIPANGTDVFSNGGAIKSAIPNPAALQGAATGGAATAGPAGVVTGGTNAAVAGGGGLLSTALSSPMLGGIVGGIGQGLMTGMAAKEQAEADEDEQKRITGSYEVDPSAYSQATVDTAARPTSEQKWGRRGRAQFNQATGQIEYVV